MAAQLSLESRPKAPYPAGMKHVFLWAALLASGANAVNLSQLKQEDVCLRPMDFKIYISDDEMTSHVEKSGNEAALTKKLTDAGFKLSDKCTYVIEMYGNANYLINWYGMESYLYLNTPSAVADPTPPIINSYTALSSLASTSIEDVRKKQSEIFAALIDQFLADWKQAHP